MSPNLHCFLCTICSSSKWGKYSCCPQFKAAKKRFTCPHLRCGIYSQGAHFRCGKCMNCTRTSPCGACYQCTRGRMVRIICSVKLILTLATLLVILVCTRGKTMVHRNANQEYQPSKMRFNVGWSIK